MRITDHPSTWTIARHRLRVEIPGAVFLWVLFAVAVTCIVGAISIPVTIGISVWEQAAQVPRWYAGVVGVYLTWRHLPLYVAHGYTRREFAAQTPVVVAAFAATLALLMTIGYAIETTTYGALGWEQALTRDHLFATPDQWPLVFVELLLAYGVWTVAGALIGAGAYRNAGLGILFVPVGVLMVGVTEYAVSDGLGPMPFGVVRLLLRPLEGITAGSAAGAAAICAAAIAVGAALAWVVIRDLPVRNRPA